MAKASEAFGDDIELIVYMDLDFTILKPLDELFNNDKADAYFVASGNIGSTLTNSFMAGKPGAKVFYECVEDMMIRGLRPPNWAYGKHLIVMTTTGPIMIDRIAKSGKNSYINLPGKLFMPCSSCNINCEVDDHAYLKPLKGGSWNGLDSKIYNACMCNWKPISTVLLIIIILIILLVIWYCIKYKYWYRK